ncbi:MAG: phosphomannomutase/phosphoglucomutase [Spirochaetes bacterium]|nr:MAG: phosphomannomutase/phosphoglucomutase [Spirochaetota bacterium]
MSIFKECDIRGVYGENLDEENAFLIGRGIGSLLSGKSVVVGGDVRVSTPALMGRLIDGLFQSGAEVINIGTVPTPLVYFAKSILKAAGAVMVTASHNPAKYNGFKIMLGEMPVTPENLKELEKKIEKKNFIDEKGSIREYLIEKEYEDFVLPLIQPHRKLKVVIDACNGAMSELAPEIFSKAGHDVIRLFCSFDGRFPNRDPNPAVYGNLNRLQKMVVDEAADIGIAFDGDGDRVVFVDNLGRFCESERSFVILMKDYLAREKSSVVYDGKSSSVVKKSIEAAGSRAIMERSGHAFIKKTFLENSSILAGEISGHFFFREFGYDDGLFAALKMTRILSGTSETMAEKIDEIEKTAITPDLRIDMNEDSVSRIMDYLSGFEENYPVSRLDGIRIEFPDGWLLVRKSVTEPCITVRLEAGSRDSVIDISNRVFGDEYPEIKQVIIQSI